jgi:hypothetical protein
MGIQQDGFPSERRSDRLARPSPRTRREALLVDSKLVIQ